MSERVVYDRLRHKANTLTLYGMMQRDWELSDCQGHIVSSEGPLEEAIRYHFGLQLPNVTFLLEPKMASALVTRVGRSEDSATSDYQRVIEQSVENHWWEGAQPIQAIRALDLSSIEDVEDHIEFPFRVPEEFSAEEWQLIQERQRQGPPAWIIAMRQRAKP